MVLFVQRDIRLGKTIVGFPTIVMDKGGSTITVKLDDDLTTQEIELLLEKCAVARPTAYWTQVQYNEESQALLFVLTVEYGEHREVTGDTTLNDDTHARLCRAAESLVLRLGK